MWLSHVISKMLAFSLTTEQQKKRLTKSTPNAIENASDLTLTEALMTNQLMTGRTPFTAGSYNAWGTVISNSILHTASTPLSLMLVKSIRNMPLEYSAGILFIAWTLAAGLSGWANYYKYIERLTEEFSLQYCDDFDFIPEPGTLYFFDVLYGENSGLHYLIHTQEKTGHKYHIKRVETFFGDDLKNHIRTSNFDHLNKLHSIQIKSTVNNNHLPSLKADANFIPGTRQDAWFFWLCALSQLPALASGAILGYTITVGKPNSLRVISATVFSLLNYIKNLLSDMPAIANAYGTNKELGNMGPVAAQPYAWLVINPFILSLLRNVAPAFLAAFTSYSLATDNTLPSVLRQVLAIILYPFIVSSFLLFTMIALRKLNLSAGLEDSSRKSAIESSLGLEHSLANANNFIARLLGELLGCRATTISGPMMYLGLSAKADASMIAVGKAAGDLALIFGPTYEIAASFLTFFFEDSANNIKMPFTYFLLLLGAFGAIMSAVSQWPNYVEYCEARQQELGLNKKRISISHNGYENLSPVTDKTIIHLASESPMDAQMQDETGKIRQVTFSDLRDNFSDSHFILYGSRSETNTVTNPLNSARNNDL